VRHAPPETGSLHVPVLCGSAGSAVQNAGGVQAGVFAASQASPTFFPFHAHVVGAHEIPAAEREVQARRRAAAVEAHASFSSPARMHTSPQLAPAEKQAESVPHTSVSRQACPSGV
jgi:hypothetical protein